MLVQARINQDAEFNVQSNREDLTNQDLNRMSEIVQNAMDGNHAENEGFSVSYNGNQNGNYSFEIKSEEFGDDLHAAFEKERNMDNEFVAESNEKMEQALNEAIKDIDKAFEGLDLSESKSEEFSK